MTSPVRLLLADDEHLIRGALAALLSLEDDLAVVAEAATGPEALAMARAHRPDVAVLDLQMPGADGVTVTTSLRAELPDCQVLIVTGHGRPGHLKRALAGVCAGSSRRRSAPSASRRSSVPCTPDTGTSTPSWPPTRSPPGTPR
ncbi:hypothetical protein GCM10010121_063220 [Streptomyces brasiliensis]|uniref:Response regulatory domain-containing protein n=1 Tax=Streptomyces brasiliensis TaxID=1954 RepID=A0A917L3S5_9ACTN|nr:hypothetical protein GCM10010121_063220 [Streptomyces brasiliensis]